MNNVNVVLAFVTAGLCLLVGAILESWLLLALSLGIAGGAFWLNHRLEQRRISQHYKATASPQTLTQYEEIHAPDFFN
jgi:uncharacterized membrane protein